MPSSVTPPPDLLARYRRYEPRSRQILEEEGRSLLRYAESRSPVRTGRFQGSWDLQVNDVSLTIINQAERAGRIYGGFVKRSGQRKTVQQEVSEELRRRSRRISQRLQDALVQSLEGR